MTTAEEYKLKNDLTVVYEHTPQTQIVSVQAWVKTGSVNETAEINGISHFLEHILFKGTENFGPDEIDNIVESSGGLMNAGTSKDYTTYYITLPIDYVETAFKVISDMVSRASFISEEIEKEKPVVVQEIQRKYDNPTYDMWKDMMNLLYAGSPYSMEVIGTEATVNSFTPEMLREYYTSHYHPRNTTLVVVGDISSKQVAALANKYFSYKSEVKAAQGYNAPWKPALKKPIREIYKRDVAQDYVLVGWQLPAVAADAPVYEVLTEILAGGEYSLLNNELKNNQGLVTAVSAGEMLYKSAGSFLAHIVTNPGESDKAVAELNKLITLVAAGKLPADDLQKAKNRLISRTVFRKEKASSEASEIGYSYTIDLKEYYKTYTSSIEAVTPKDVAAAAAILVNTPAAVYKTVPINPGQ